MNEEVLFDRLVTRPSDEWGKLLDEACGADATLRAKVESLLNAYQRADGLFETPALGYLSAEAPISRPTEEGGTIGPYKLLQKIGEGGMGVVFMAEQQHPVSRRVAIKIVKPGLDSREVMARFEAERQALAMMEHPNIAKVLDAGETDSGHPFFVMELVKGLPITRFCDEECLSSRERLELFIPVCEAVQHAHQKGVIHRDLKPSNVLVAMFDGKPIPKIIDFGIAKALKTRLTERTIFTGFGQLVGTYEYMSPEQAHFNQLDIDTRSDVYSLGVLLYELLTGSPPFPRDRLRTLAFDEMLRVIREEDPPKPSTSVTSRGRTAATFSAQRRAPIRQVAQFVRGDLDLILLKSLEKERNRRYATARDLATDLNRFLHSQPIEARPPAILYRFHKFVHRNKVLVAGIAATLTMLIVGIVATSLATIWAVSEARAQRKLARDLTAELFVSDMAVAQQALSKNDIGEVRRIITPYLEDPPPQAGFELQYLANVCEVAERAHTIEIPYKAYSVDISKDGSLIVVGMSNDSVAVIRSSDGEAVARFGTGNKYWAHTCVSLTSDGESVAYSRGADVIVQSIHDQRAHPARTLGGHESTITEIALSPDNSRLASVAMDGQVRIWRVQDGECVQTLHYEKDQLYSVAWSPDQELIAAGSEDGFLRIWRLSDGTILHTFQAHDHCVESIDFSPDSKVLASGGVDRSLQLWDVESGKRLGDRMWHADNLFCVRFDPTGRFVASASRAGDVKIWSVDQTTEVRKLRYHSGLVTAIAFSHDGHWLVSASDDFTIVVSKFDPNIIPDTIASSFWVEQMVLTADGQRLCYIAPGVDQGAGDRGIDSQRQVMVWNMSQHRYEAPIAVSGFPIRIQVSPSGWLAVANEAGGVELWNLDTREKRDLILVPNEVALSLAFRHSDNLLAIGQKDGAITIWDLKTGTLTGELRGHARPIRDLVFSPDGNLLAAGSDDGSASVWDVSNGSLMRRCEGHRAAVMCVDLSPDGKMLATGGWDNDVKLWDLTEPLSSGIDHQLGRHALWVSEVRFSRDGRFLYSSGGDHTVRIWNLASGRQQFSLPEHGSAIMAMEISPDDRTIITGGRDNAIRFWRTKMPLIPDWPAMASPE